MQQNRKKLVKGNEGYHIETFKNLPLYPSLFFQNNDSTSEIFKSFEK